MAAESLTDVRHRIGLQIAEIESRAARARPVDIGASMAAIRALAHCPGNARVQPAPR